MSASAKRVQPARRAAKPTGRGVINIRAGDEERSLIDRAAQLTGKSRSEFMLGWCRSR
ncbi:DUF1778 domain-containing protein [Leptolyngbya sp. 15MV]|nr:DUF1778 domain-containing protein [Leptolyngbya sp. 15MV]